MPRTIDFSHYTSIKIGPVVDVQLIEEPIKTNAFIIGAGNNLLVSQNPPKLAMLGKTFNFISLKKNLLHVGASTKSGQLLSFAKKYNFAHFELLQKLPGNIGGIIKMNAGLKEWEIFNSLNSVKIDDNWVKKEDIQYGYRHTNISGIIYEVIFNIEYGFDNNLLEMFKKFRDNQPNLPSAGSCFKNPPNNFAGKLLDDAGLKGYHIGDMSFSKTHANFLVNHEKGTFEDAISLISLAKKTVFEKFGIQLDCEITVVDS